MNSVRKIIESRMMSKAELARKADVTVQTIDRIEQGNKCRLETKRKIILGLGFELSDRGQVFAGDEWFGRPFYCFLKRFHIVSEIMKKCGFG